MFLFWFWGFYPESLQNAAWCERVLHAAQGRRDTWITSKSSGKTAERKKKKKKASQSGKNPARKGKLAEQTRIPRKEDWPYLVRARKSKGGTGPGRKGEVI